MTGLPGHVIPDQALREPVATEPLISPLLPGREGVFDSTLEQRVGISTQPSDADSAVNEVLRVSAHGGMAELGQRLCFDLTNPLPGKTKTLAYFF